MLPVCANKGLRSGKENWVDPGQMVMAHRSLRRQCRSADLQVAAHGLQAHHYLRIQLEVRSVGEYVGP